MCRILLACSSKFRTIILKPAVAPEHISHMMVIQIELHDNLCSENERYFVKINLMSEIMLYYLKVSVFGQHS